MSVKEGDVWWVKFDDPSKGQEFQGRHPALIVSAPRYNGMNKEPELVVIVPITGTDYGIPSRVMIKPPEGGLMKNSYAMCEQIKSIDVSRRLDGKMGIVSAATLFQIRKTLAMVLGIRC